MIEAFKKYAEKEQSVTMQRGAGKSTWDEFLLSIDSESCFWDNEKETTIYCLR
jgi:hypothetical protein